MNQSPKSVCTKHLQQPQIHEIGLVKVEFHLIGIDEWLQFLFIVLNQFVACGLRHLRLHLIEQRNHIIIQRAFSSALEVDEIQFVIFHHNVARLEISVHEEFAWGLADEIGEGLEILAQSRLVELDFLVRLDEIVFEIVQVVENALTVETLGRVGFAVIKSLMTNTLEPY